MSKWRGPGVVGVVTSESAPRPECQGAEHSHCGGSMSLSCELSLVGTPQRQRVLPSIDEVGKYTYISVQFGL